MKKTYLLTGMAAMLCIAAQAQTNQPTIPPGKLAVFKAGTTNNIYNMSTARVAPCFVQIFDPAITNASSTNPLLSVAMATNSSVPGSIWINHHAGSEGGGLSRSVNREYLCMEGYVGNILSPTAAKPSTDASVNRGIVTLDAFTNAVSVLTTPTGWFGIPLGSAPGTQDNPTGIASPDGTNFYGTGNFAAIGSGSGELDGTLFYNSQNGNLQEVQQYLQAAGEARIIGGVLLVATKFSSGSAASGLYSFIDPASGSTIPLPWDPDVPNPYFNFSFTNLYLSWGAPFITVLNFDMDPGHTVAYGADEVYGIVKLTNNSGTWVQAPYYWSSTNIGTLKQSSSAPGTGCFGICVDFSGPNPIIYATTMENGADTNYPGGLGANNNQGHPNNNRIIEIEDTGISPGTNYVATTLAIASTTNEFFGGIDFTPDLTPLITSQPADYSTTVGGSASFTVTAQSVYALSYQWLQNGTNLVNATGSSLSLSGLDSTYDGDTYQCIITNNYGAATSRVATLTVTATPTPPVITSGTNYVTAFIGGTVTFAPVTASGTQPFTYQWHLNGTNLVDDGVKYVNSTTPSLTISNLTLADAGSYYMVVMNPSPSYASNIVDVLTVVYRKATINAGEPASVITFTNVPTSLTADETGASLPVTNQWYEGSTILTEGAEYTGTQTPTLNIAASTTADSGNNYYLVVSNPGGSVTSLLATVTVLIPPPHSQVNYSNQVYSQAFDVLPDPGSQGQIKNTPNAAGTGVSVNSINNPLDPGQINGASYSLASPFDFAFPVIPTSYIGGLGIGTGGSQVTNSLGKVVVAMDGWYGAADTNRADAGNPDGITRFGAQDGDQSTGGVIDFGPNDANGGIIGTNRALGLLSTSSTGSTAFGLKLVNSSTNTLNYITLSFIGELWRNNRAARTMSFSYAVDPTANTFVLMSEPTATNAAPQVIPGTIRLPNLAFSFPTNDGSVLAYNGLAPSNQVSMVASNLALATPWQPGAALWLVWSINYYGQGTGQGYAIDNLKFSASTVPTTLIRPITINSSSVKITGSGASAAASFSFTNASGLSFSIRATNNLTAPKAAWPVIGTAVENPPGSGSYQFTDPTPSTNGVQFYMISVP